MLMTDPFRDFRFGGEFDRMQHEMNHLIGGPRTVARSRFPLVNVWVKQDSAVVTAEVPGFAAGDFDLSVLNKSLTISGKREDNKDGKVHRQERKPDEFQRTVHLPFQLDSEKVQAAYQNGILTITCPRAEADKPRKIEIN